MHESQGGDELFIFVCVLKVGTIWLNLETTDPLTLANVSEDKTELISSLLPLTPLPSTSGASWNLQGNLNRCSLSEF